MKPLKVERFSITQNKEACKQGSWVCVSSIGCGVEECHCSPEYFMSMSDGKTGLTVGLNKNDMLKMLLTVSKGGLWEKHGKPERIVNKIDKKTKEVRKK